MIGGIAKAYEFYELITTNISSSDISVSRNLYKTVSELYKNSYICDMVFKSNFRQFILSKRNETENYDNPDWSRSTPTINRKPINYLFQFT